MDIHGRPPAMNGNLGIPEVSPEPLGILMVDLRELTVWMDKLMVDIGRPQFVAGRDPMSDKPGSDQDMICQTATRYDLSTGILPNKKWRCEL